MPNPHKKYKKVILVILDGFGVASYSRGNAIALAGPEVLNYLVGQFPSATLQASGPLVGLPWGEMGNSEVGHLNIGAGRIVGQDLPRVTNSIQTGEFFRNKEFLAAMNHVKQNSSTLHLVGMISPGGVHSLDEHLYALLGMAKDQGINQVYIHMFTDGRDTGEKIAIESVQKLKEKIATIGVGKIATITGRFYAMDRGEHWEQTEATYQAIVNGIGIESESPESCILENYNHNIFDEMILPTVIMETDENTGSKVPVGRVKDNDAVIFFNFRSDRAVQLTRAFVSPETEPIERKHVALRNLYFVTMTEYLHTLPVHAAFPPMDLANNLALYLSRQNFTQYHVAESEKYAHVTAFFNCGISEMLPGEDREIISSPSNSKNYVDHPEMSAVELTNSLISRITSTETNFFVANFANPDMVGHTGDLKSSIRAVQHIDKALERIMEKALLVDAALIITGDHGNIEQMINVQTGEIDKDHTTNPVPFILVANEFRQNPPSQRDYLSLSSKVPIGVISDIAPTVLDLFGLQKPAEMTAISLLPILGIN